MRKIAVFVSTHKTPLLIHIKYSQTTLEAREESERESIKIGQDVTQPALEPSPFFLDGIQVG